MKITSYFCNSSSTSRPKKRGKGKLFKNAPLGKLERVSSRIEQGEVSENSSFVASMNSI